VHKTQGIVNKVCVDAHAQCPVGNIRFLAAVRDVIDRCANLPVNLSNNPAQETTNSSDFCLHGPSASADIIERSWNWSNSFHLHHRSFFDGFPIDVFIGKQRPNK